MLKSFTFVALIVGSLGSVAMADFDQWKQRADAYRGSGQLEQADRERQAQADRAENPLRNRNYKQSIREFIQNTGGWVSQPRYAYNSEGRIETAEFESRDLSCRITNSRGLCVNKKTMHEYECEVGYFWAIVCSAVK